MEWLGGGGGGDGGVGTEGWGRRGGIMELTDTSTIFSIKGVQSPVRGHINCSFDVLKHVRVFAEIRLLSIPSRLL